MSRLGLWASFNCEAHVKVNARYAEIREAESADEADESQAQVDEADQGVRAEVDSKKRKVRDVVMGEAEVDEAEESQLL